MRWHIVIGVCGGLLLVGSLVAGAWLYWEDWQVSSAWVVEEPEQVVANAQPGKEVSVVFRLRNTSGRPLRILGSDAC